MYFVLTNLPRLTSIIMVGKDIIDKRTMIPGTDKKLPIPNKKISKLEMKYFNLFWIENKTQPTRESIRIVWPTDPFAKKSSTKFVEYTTRSINGYIMGSKNAPFTMTNKYKIRDKNSELITILNGIPNPRLLKMYFCCNEQFFGIVYNIYYYNLSLLCLAGFLISRGIKF